MAPASPAPPAATADPAAIAPSAAAAAFSGSHPKQKLHGRAFYESIGSPKYIVAPMVDQSEFAWRMLIRSFLPPNQRKSVLAYSPMLHARLFVDSLRYRTSHFEATRGGVEERTNGKNEPAQPQSDGLRPFLDGNPAIDRPLFVQFCANDPDALLAAARRVAPHCDAVDLNLGCPQGIARKGHYGAFLQEEPELIAKLVRTLHEHLDVPVTAKIRLLDTPEESLRYARTVLDAGASILTVHGRRRAQKGHLTGLADWPTLRYLRDHLPPETVLFANGNVLQKGDLARCLAATGFDGVMSAEGLLSDPGLFGPVLEVSASLPSGEQQQQQQRPQTIAPSETGASDADDYFWPTPDPHREYWTSSRRSWRGGWRVDAVVRRYLDILHVYALGKKAPPARKPLFIVGDPVDWLDEEDKKEDEAKANAGAGGDEQGGKKKRKRDGHDAAAAKDISPAAFSSPNFVAVQAHLFHLLRHAVARHHDVRDALARSRKGDIAAYERILAMLERRVARALLAGEEDDDDDKAADEKIAGEEKSGNGGEEEGEIVDDPNSSAAAVRRCRRPWWVVQPVLRPMPAEALAKGAIQLTKKAKAELSAKEEEAATQAEAENPKQEKVAAPAAAAAALAA